jgi:hypothetical protein
VEDFPRLVAIDDHALSDSIGVRLHARPFNQPSHIPVARD